MIVLELMPNGNLKDFLIQNRPRYLTLQYVSLNFIRCTFSDFTQSYNTVPEAVRGGGQ